MDFYLRLELRRFQEFNNMGHIDHKTNDWDLLYLMQHHGVKTRLLDWTESFAAALFFAYINWKPQIEDACVWMLAPAELNYLSLGRHALYTPDNLSSYIAYLDKELRFPDSSLALYPVRNNKRIVAQQGVFTLQGNSMLPLDQEMDRALLHNGYLIKLSITEDLIDDVRYFLKLSGVNYFTLFPDLDGLAKHINMETLDEVKFPATKQ